MSPGSCRQTLPPGVTQMKLHIYQTLRFPSKAMEIEGAFGRFRELLWAWSISRIGRCLGKQLAQHLYSTQTTSNMPGQSRSQLLDMCPDRDSITFQDSTKKSLKIGRQAMCLWQEELSAWMLSVCCKMAECTYTDGPSSSLCSWKWLDRESLANLFCKFRIS